MANKTEQYFPEGIPKIMSFSVIEFDNVYSTRFHGTTYNELLYVLSGRVTLHLEGNRHYSAQPGDFLLVPAGTQHRDEFTLLKGLRILMINFAWDNKEFFRVMNNRMLSNLSHEVRTEVRRRLEFMRSHWNETEIGLRNASIQFYGILLLFYFDALQAEKKAAAPKLLAGELMERAKHFLDQNYSSPLTLMECAGFLGISPSYLSRLFHREYGIGFNACLTAKRLENACHLLQTSSLQIGEIAASCGFSSANYFIKVFRRQYGITPKVYAIRYGGRVL